MSNVAFRDVRKSYGAVEVIHGVDLEIKSGEFAVFVGPSGCGKSTLLRMIAGLEEISAGDIMIGGERMNDIRPARRGVAMVFQSYALYPHMTVYKNMSFSLRLARLPKDEIDRKVRVAAETLQITEFLDRVPSNLSGGQQQRVAIGRAFVREPKVFLFDEPLSNLDAALRMQTRVEIAKLHQSVEATMIYVTHDQVEAMTLADRIVVLNKGVVEQVGTPLELYHHPANLFVAGFIGSPKMNFLQVSAKPSATGVEIVKERHDGSAARLDLPMGAKGGIGGMGTATLGIRPEHLFPSDTGMIRATVELVEQLGEYALVHLTSDEGVELSMKILDASGLSVGGAIKVGFDPANAHLFDGNGAAFPRTNGDFEPQSVA